MTATQWFALGGWDWPVEVDADEVRVEDDATVQEFLLEHGEALGDD